MKHAFRIGYHRTYDDTVFDEHLAFIRQHREDIDEITMFVQYSHYGYWPLDERAEHAALIARRVKQYREIGIPSVGLNVLCTIGHLDESWDLAPHTDMQHIVGVDGEESRSCLCPSGEDFLDYAAGLYRLYAGTGVDFIWMDDDIRMISHNSWENCYCPRCLRLFGERQGRTFDREGLLAALAAEPGLQKEWDAFRAGVIRRLCATIEKAVHGVSPDIKIGFMSGGSVSNDRADWVRAAGATMCRPGDGFYRDDLPYDILRKNFDVAQQVLHYPPEATDIQYEFEDFSYQTLQKSRCMEELESAMSLMVGCTGVLYNDIFFDDKPRLLAMVHERKAQWQALTDRAGTHNVGVFCTNYFYAQKFHEIGIPVTADIDYAVAALVLGDQWEDLGREKAARLLAGGVLTDGSGVEALTRMGLSSMCGGRVAGTFTNGMAERFAHHPINGVYGGYYRDVFMTFRGANVCHTLTPDAGGEILSRLETVSHIPGDCSLYRIVRPDGGRIAVDGYFQKEDLQSEAKRHQVLQLLDWLSGGRLPVLIQAPCKVAPLVRADGEGGFLVMLSNVCFDDTGALEVRLRGVTGPIYTIALDGTLAPVDTVAEEDGVTVRVENIGPWRYVLLTNRR